MHFIILRVLQHISPPYCLVLFILFPFLLMPSLPLCLLFFFLFLSFFTLSFPNLFIFSSSGSTYTETVVSLITGYTCLVHISDTILESTFLPIGTFKYHGRLGSPWDFIQRSTIEKILFKSTEWRFAYIFI